MNQIKVEIGGQRQIPGWINLDHRNSAISDLHPRDFNIMTEELPFADGSVDYFYMSHVIEHMPVVRAFAVLQQFFRKLKPGGKLRILTPDLRQVAQAYVDGNVDAFVQNAAPWASTHFILEHFVRHRVVGAYFMNEVAFSTGDELKGDASLITKSGKFLCSTSHISGWDYEMLAVSLKEIGFSRVERTEANEDIDPRRHKEQLCVNAFK